MLNCQIYFELDIRQLMFQEHYFGPENNRIDSNVYIFSLHRFIYLLKNELAAT